MRQPSRPVRRDLSLIATLQPRPEQSTTVVAAPEACPELVYEASTLGGDRIAVRLQWQVGIAAVFGKWPGDETDEEFDRMVEDLS